MYRMLYIYHGMHHGIWKLRGHLQREERARGSCNICREKEGGKEKERESWQSRGREGEKGTAMCVALSTHPHRKPQPILVYHGAQDSGIFNIISIWKAESSHLKRPMAGGVERERERERKRGSFNIERGRWRSAASLSSKQLPSLQFFDHLADLIGRCFMHNLCSVFAVDL